MGEFLFNTNFAHNMKICIGFIGFYLDFQKVLPVEI